MRPPPRRIAAFLVLAVSVGAAGTWLASGASHRQPANRPVVVAHSRRAVHPHARVSVLRLPRLLGRTTIDLPILMYHRIGPLSPSLPAMTRALTVAPATFARQMDWLIRHGYHAISQRQAFAALEQGAPLPPKPVMITFDDGYRDVLWNAAPLLYRLGLPATAYVITGRISGSDSSFLTWDELRLLEARGVGIGSHTVDHAELPFLTTRRALWELRRSRRQLEQRLHHPVQWFAYPAGAETPRAAQLVREAGYVLAVTTRPGDMQRESAPLTLHRQEVLSSTSLGTFARLVG